MTTNRVPVPSFGVWFSQRTGQHYRLAYLLDQKPPHDRYPYFLSFGRYHADGHFTELSGWRYDDSIASEQGLDGLFGWANAMLPTDAVRLLSPDVEEALLSAREPLVRAADMDPNFVALSVLVHEIDALLAEHGASQSLTPLSPTPTL